MQIIAEKTGKSIGELKEAMSAGAISAEMVQQAFIDATSAGGKFFNMSLSASKTINGQLSMIEDAWDNALNTIGTSTEGIIMGGLKATQALIENYETVGKVLVTLVASYGAYRTAVMLATIATSKHTLAEVALTKVRWLARKAQLALNASMITNPYVALTTAVVALGGAIWAFSKRADDAVNAQDALARISEKTADEFDSQAAKVDRLAKALNDSNAPLEQRRKALQELKSIIPDYNADLTEEGNIINNNTAAIQNYLVQLEKEIKLKAAQEELEELYRKKRQQERAVEDAQADYDRRKQASTGAVLVGGEMGQLAQKTLLDDAVNAEKALTRAKNDLAGTQSVIAEIEAEIRKVGITAEEETAETVSTIGDEVKAAKDKVSELTKALEDLRSGKTQVEAGKTVEAAIREKMQELEEARKTLQVLTGEDGKKAKEQQVDTAVVVDYKKIEDVRKQIEDDLYAERQAMNEYIIAYGSYMQQREALTDKYTGMIERSETEGERLMLIEQMKEALSELDIAAGNTASAISQLFGDMRDKTLQELNAIADKGQQALEFLKAGEWDETTGMQLGISKETFEVWSKSPEKLKAIADALKDNRDAAEDLRPAYDKVADGLKRIFESGTDVKKLKTGLSDLSDGMSSMLGVTDLLKDSFDAMGNAFDNDILRGVADGLNIAMDAVSSTLSGAQAGAAFGPIGAAIGGAIGLVNSLVESVASLHDKPIQKNIDALQDQVDELSKEYEALGRAIDKAYSTDAADLIRQQNQKLEEQKKLIQEQMEEEKKLKDPDEDKLMEYQNTLDDINLKIEENKEAAMDAIFGSDLQSAIEGFSASLTDAWANGKNVAQSTKDFVRQMMQEMVSEAIKGALAASGAIEDIRKTMLSFMADGIMTDWEQEYLQDMADKIAQDIENQYGWAEDLFKESQAEQTATGKGFGTEMTHEDASELSGRFTALQVTGEQQRVIAANILENVVTMSSVIANFDTTFMEIRTLLIEQNSYLFSLAGYGKKTLALLTEKLESIIGTLNRL